MQTGTTIASRELPVKLTEHEIAERGEIIAAKMLRVKALRKKRREDFRNMTAQIDAELDNMQQIAETLMAGVELRKQSDLKFGDEVVPSQTEAAEALDHVAEIAGEKPLLYHRNGALCRKDNCRRAHHAPEALRAQGIKLEGDELAPTTDGDAPLAEKCGGCDRQLEGVERVKGLCETCQTSAGGDPLEGTPEAAAVDELAREIEAANIEGVIPEDDPRPRCHIAHCRAVLDADEVEKPEPESEEHPALGGEAGA